MLGVPSLRVETVPHGRFVGRATHGPATLGQKLCIILCGLIEYPGPTPSPDLGRTRRPAHPHRGTLRLREPRGPHPRTRHHPPSSTGRSRSARCASHPPPIPAPHHRHHRHARLHPDHGRGPHRPRRRDQRRHRTMSAPLPLCRVPYREYSLTTYRSPAAARKTARRRRRHEPRHHVFHCPACGPWHIARHDERPADTQTMTQTTPTPRRGRSDASGAPPGTTGWRAPKGTRAPFESERWVSDGGELGSMR